MNSEPERLILRPEEAGDFRESEELTREAFWNRYRPGCCEHFLLHRFRGDPALVRELDLVLEDVALGRLLGHILFCRAALRLDSGGTLPILVLGPVSILPEAQGKGLGSLLIRRTLEKAAALGYGAVALTGSPAYYPRFGFVPAADFGVRYEGIPAEEPTPFFMLKELRPGYLKEAAGVYADPPGYRYDEAELDAFDAGFPQKTKERRPGQIV